MNESKLMKDGLGEAAIQRIANSLLSCEKTFPSNSFIRDANKGLLTLELKERVHHVIAALHRALPQPFKKTAKLFQQLPKHWDKGDPNDALRGFAAWPIIDYMAVYGLEHPNESLKTLEILTSLFSAEFAIRPFIQQHFEYTHKVLLEWSTHKDEHVRRLASEGARPRLPWGMQLPQFIKDPAPLIPILETLKDDTSLYVRRSVANNLNDISKDNPALTLELCTAWSILANNEIDWVIKHACRSLIKQGHPAVFALLGYSKNPKLSTTGISLSEKQIKIGKKINFTVELKNPQKSPQNVVVDYAIHFTKANKKLAPKVFKLRSLSIEPGASITLSKNHDFKKISTRKYYPGEHIISIHINGVEIERCAFELLTE
jgi:3-methyladenine DNA glycosylase AlkC